MWHISARCRLTPTMEREMATFNVKYNNLVQEIVSINLPIVGRYDSWFVSTCFTKVSSMTAHSNLGIDVTRPKFLGSNLQLLVHHENKRSFNIA